MDSLRQLEDGMEGRGQDGGKPALWRDIRDACRRHGRKTADRRSMGGGGGRLAPLHTGCGSDKRSAARISQFALGRPDDRELWEYEIGIETRIKLNSSPSGPNSRSS